MIHATGLLPLAANIRIMNGVRFVGAPLQPAAGRETG